MTMGIALVVFLNGLDRWCSSGNDHINFELDQLGREHAQPITFSLTVAILNDDVLSLNMAKFPQTLPECFDTV
jgi:hypothetical protein